MLNALYNEVKEDQPLPVSSQKDAVYSGTALSLSGNGFLPTSAFSVNTLAPTVRKYKAGENLSANDAVFLAPGDGSANSNYITLVASSTQYLSAVDSTSLSVTGSMTVEGWINLTSQPGANLQMGLFSKWLAAGNQKSWRFYYEDSAGTKRFHVQTSADGTTHNEGTVNYTFVLSTWTHVAFVYTASASQVQIFVNGASQGTIAGLTASLFDNTQVFTIGTTDSSPTDSYLDASVDDVRVWASARTGAQIIASYKVQLAGNETNLNGYWRLNNTLVDQTTNNNTLTNNGTAAFASSTLPFAGGEIFRTKADTTGMFETFVGFVQSATPPGSSVNITIGGEMGSFSSLQKGSQYFLSNSAGAIATTAGTNTRKVGISTSSTTLLITNIF